MAREAFDMTEPKRKLRNLGSYMPGANSYVVMYGRYLAERLNPQLVPMGFILGCELVIHDLHKGVDGFTQGPIPIEHRKLVGMPAMFYNILRIQTPLIAKAVLEPADAEEVQREYDAMMAHIKEQQSK